MKRNLEGLGRQFLPKGKQPERLSDVELPLFDEVQAFAEALQRPDVTPSTAKTLASALRDKLSSKVKTVVPETPFDLREKSEELKDRFGEEYTTGF